MLSSRARRQVGSTRLLVVLCAGIAAVGALIAPTASAATKAGPAIDPGSLPVCQHFYTGPIPTRPIVGGTDPGTLAPPVDVSNRLPAPTRVSGTLNANGTVTFTFNRVAGAVAYRAFRNGQALQWISDWGQPSFLVTDSAPCQNANYQVYAMSADNTDPSVIGQISTSYQVGSDDQLAPYSIPSGTQFTYTITSYNDGGQTALGYDAGLGFCAVDARYIPWGTRFTVPGYGSCYAADIGDWIEGDIVDVWLPGGEANNWGVQQQTITIN
jgi:3D (Asp-Asp-Asp) domain-containing protein